MIMNTRQNRLIIFALLLLTQTPLGAQLHSTKIELPEDSISVTMEDSIPAKRSFFKKFLDYFNDANKEKKNKKFDFSVIGGPTIPVTPSSDSDWWQPDYIAPIGTIRFFLPPMSLFTEMCRRSASICWESVETICFRKTNTA